MKKLIISLFIAAMIIGCASPKQKGVAVGMSMNEVQNLIGPPTRVKKLSCPAGSRNCTVVWEYDGYQVAFVDGFVEATQ